MQAQAPLKIIMYYLIADVSLGMEQPTLDKWLEMGILGNWTAYNASNTNETLIDKTKTPCLWFSNTILLFKKGKPLVSTPAASAVRFIIITIFKCLSQCVLNNFTIIKRVHCFLSSGRQEEKS
jgi:hypothetical protein